MKKGMPLLGLVAIFLLQGCSVSATQDGTAPTADAQTIGVFHFENSNSGLLRAALRIAPPATRAAQDAQLLSNYFEVWGRRYNAALKAYEIFLLYPNPALGNSGVNPGADVSDIEIAIEPGLWDLVLLAGYKDAAYCATPSGKPLLLGLAGKERQHILRGQTDIAVTIEPIQVSVYAPAKVQRGTAFAVECTVDFKSAGLAATPFVSTAPDSRVTIVSGETPAKFSPLSLEHQSGYSAPQQNGSSVTEFWRFRAPAVAGLAKIRIDYWYASIFGTGLFDDQDRRWAIADFTNPNGALGPRYAQTLTFTPDVPAWSGTDCYVNQYGDDASGTGDKYRPFATTYKAVNAIKAAYNKGVGWPTDKGKPVPVTIYVSGTIMSDFFSGTGAMVDIRGANGYPPLVVKGKSAEEPGVLNASIGIQNGVTVTDGNTVTFGENLTIVDAWHGVDAESGSTFCLQGGTVDNSVFYAVFSSDSDIIINGGKILRHPTGIYMTGGALRVQNAMISTTSRAIYIAYADSVDISNSTLTGGFDGLSVTNVDNVTVANSTISSSSTGISANNVARFTMSGGEITGNAYGINARAGTAFDLSDCTVSAGSFGVYVDDTSLFTMTGGSILPPVSFGAYVAPGGILSIRTVPPITATHYGPIPDTAHLWP